MFVGSAVWLACAEGRAGTLVGVVSTADGLPADRADVTVVGPDGKGVASALTAEDGAFEFDRLAAGRYYVVAVPAPEATDTEAWAPSATERCAGEPFDVEDDDGVVVADLTLLPGAALTGILLLPDGSPAIDALVTARPETGASARTARTGPDGAFEVRGIAPSDITIAFDAPEVPIQYWAGEYAAGSAWVLSVGLEGPADLGSFTLLDSAVVAGTVAVPEGTVADGEVTLQVAGQRLTAPIALDGTWESARLPAGDVLVSADVPGLAKAWWPDLDRPGEEVAALVGERLDGIDLALVPESRIRGELVPAPWGTGDAAVVVLHNDDSSFTRGATIDLTGQFQYTRLRAGEYRLWLDGTSNDRLAGFLEEDDGTPRVITVADGEIVELGALEMPLAARIEGTVVDASTGGPIVGAYVVATPLDGEGEELDTLTDSHGWFAVRGLAAGTFELRAGYVSTCPTDPEWVTIWHPDTPNDLFASVVEVTAGETTTWAARLPPDADHDGMDDVWEADNGLDPAADDAELDPDEDGFDNLAEYLLGTDPTPERERADKGCGCAARAAPLPSGALVGLLALGLRSRSTPSCRTGWRRSRR